MDRTNIIIYTPIRNAQNWAETTLFPCGIDVQVIDNCSTDKTVEVLMKRSINCAVNPKDYGRIGNWTECIDKFIKSDKRWMKWLFAGDELNPLFSDIVDGLDETIFSSGFIIFDTMDDSDCLHSPKEYGLAYGYNSPEAIARAVSYYSFGFNGPIAHMINREIAKEIQFRQELPFIAYELECLRMASKYGVFWVDAVVGKFVSKRRLFLQSEQNIVAACVQIYIIRTEALCVLKNESNDEIQRLKNDITARFAVQAFMRSIRQQPFLTLKFIFKRFLTAKK